MRKPLVAILAVVALAVGLPLSNAQPRTQARKGSAIKFLLDIERGRAEVPTLPNGLQIPLPSGGMQDAIHDQLPSTERAALTAQQEPVTLPKINIYGCRHVFRREGFPANVRANVDCGFRQQAEEWVAVNPTDPRNVVVSQNDSKLQGNRTGIDFSRNGGRAFGDSVLPNGRVLLPEIVPSGEYSFDAFTDPAHTWDSQGNLYYTAIGFDAFQTFFAGVFVWKSHSCLKGSFIHTPDSGSCDPFEPPINGSAIPIRTNFDNDTLSDDKQLMAADYFEDSPFRDNVYVTWTIFDFSCEGGSYCESPIFFSRSEDGGVTWSEALEISGVSPEHCNFGDLFNPEENPNSCNFSQGSYPVVGPDGTIYVIFNNANTSEEAAIGDGVAQQLLVKSTDAGETWSDPIKVADDFQQQPFSLPGNEIPDCPDFRQCLPPNGFRMNDFPSLGINNNTGRLAAFWADFRNGGPCAENTDFGAPLPVLPCENINNDVFAAVSTDGGETWSEPKLVSPPKPNRSAAQWQPWGDVGENGKLYVGYYDRGYGCEATGCNDITLARSSNNGNTWRSRRITTRSMPNLTCDQNPFQCGFLGDYMSIQAFKGKVHMTWADTRGRDLGFPEADAYYAKVDA